MAELRRKSSAKRGGGFKIYKSYRFSGQDPAVGDVLSELQAYDEGDVAQLSGLAKSTLKAWRKRKTRRPQHATLEAALRAVGKRFVIEDDRDE